ncbi:MAG: hypothetical protein IT424_11890 [Pirellulales bacterium]|nr:hypothetical protein [Pirellulales bacterium]
MYDVPPIDVSLTFTLTGKHIVANVEMANRGEKDIHIENVNLPLDGQLTKRLFEVMDVNGKEVEFVGPRVKLPGSGPNDYFSLEPARDVKFSIRIDNLYAFETAAPPVKVRYSVVNVKRDESELELIQSDWYELPKRE